MPESIDAHQHLWSYQFKEYAWISKDMSVLARDYLPEQLKIEMKKANVDGAVVVQARQTVSETEWLLSLARNSPILRGVVGWAPICSEIFAQELERLQQEEKLKGLRHVIQDEPDDNFILRTDFNRGISAMAHSGLVYDILIFARQLPAAIQFVDRHPHQIFVLDHIAKPSIKEGIIEPWRTNIRQLAERKNIYCKLSGMVTEANWPNWSAQNLQPYLETVLETFGPGRLMAGSDWPVCLLASTYTGWFTTLHQMLHSLSAAEKENIFGAVASRVYRLQQKED